MPINIKLEGEHLRLNNLYWYVMHKNYEEFTEESAKEWANTHYKLASESLSDIGKKIISKYCKDNEPVINKVLRSGNLSMNMKEINFLDSLVSIKKLPTNIIVYRIISVNIFSCKNTYTEEGYMSTSLVNGDINHIHRGDYRLKIYLPQKIGGFYVDFISCRHGEYEFLLPRNKTLYKVKSYKAEDGKIEIICNIK